MNAPDRAGAKSPVGESVVEAVEVATRKVVKCPLRKLRDLLGLGKASVLS
jgi:hypothetical protein